MAWRQDLGLEPLPELGAKKQGSGKLRPELALDAQGREQAACLETPQAQGSWGGLGEAMTEA